MTRLSSCIAPAFYPVHTAVKRDRYTHYWLKGGRGSTKSSFVALEIVLGIMEHPGTNAVALRKVGMYLKMGFEDGGMSQSCWGGESWHEMTYIL